MKRMKIENLYSEFFFFSDSTFKLKLGVAHIASQVTLKFWASHLGKGSALIRWTMHDV